MSKKDELRVSVNNEINDYDDYLSRAKKIVDLIPIVEERKQEAEAKKIALDYMPDELLTELAPNLFEVQKEDDSIRKQFLPTLPVVSKQSYSQLSSSGSTAVFYEAIATNMQSQDSPQIWATPINKAFSDLAQTKATRMVLPGLMGEVRGDLNLMFKLANESVPKAKHGVVGIDQAIDRMRGVIQQLWGALTQKARQNCPDKLMQRLELKKQNHRSLVVECLAPLETRKTFSAQLDGLYSLYQDFSPEAKNILGEDQSMLEQFHTRWILQIEGLLKLIQ